MFTVIIPTMWKVPHITTKLLELLQGIELVGEILLIANSPEVNITNHTKITILNEGRPNLGVNPSWNLGALWASNDYLCILNDDIIPDINIFSVVKDKYREKSINLIGFCPGEPDFDQPAITDGAINIIKHTNEHNYGFGSMFFIRRSTWVHIPETLKTYFGDDFIYNLAKKRQEDIYLITNMKFEGTFAATTKDFLDNLAVEQEIFKKFNPLTWSGSYNIQQELKYAYLATSDINEHVTKLNELANECSVVTEFGVRDGVSTRAFLASSAKVVISYDIISNDYVQHLFLQDSRQVNAYYGIRNSLNAAYLQTDMLFIDSEHTAQHLEKELEFSILVNKYIVIHDTTSYYKTLLPVVLNFINNNKDWIISELYSNNNGLIVLKRINKKKNILVAVPTNNNITTDTFKSIANLRVPDNYTLRVEYFYGYKIDQVRNLIADWGKKYDYTLCIDSDIVVPEDALIRLLAADKDIVGGIYSQRLPDRKLEVYYITDSGGFNNIPYWHIKDKSLVEVGAIGFGCVLIKKRVFDTIPYPHFVYLDALDHKNTISEDIYFCKKARDYGFSTWALADLVLPHIGKEQYLPIDASVEYVKDVYNSDLLPIEHVSYLYNMEASPKVIWDIGSCVQHWTRHAVKKWSSSTILCFDPNTDVIPLYNEVPLYNIALSNAIKTVPYYKVPFNLGGNSIYKENTDVFASATAVEITTNTIDNLVKEGLPSPELLKIDVQGSELDVLKGAHLALSTTITDIIIEAQHKEYNIGAPKFTDIEQFLTSYNFVLVSKISSTNVDADYHFTKKVI